MGRCIYLTECGGCESINLEEKVAMYAKLLQINNFEVFKSLETGFRGRCELGIYHKESDVFYAMRRMESKVSNKAKKSPFICIQNCQNLLPNIQKTLPALQAFLNCLEFYSFRERLFSIEILANNNNALLISFIYHRKLDGNWLESAEALKEKLESKLHFQFFFVGRSRGIKLVLGQDYLVQNLNVLGKNYVYRYDEGAFTQPNPAINAQMIAWVLEHSMQGGDLLELYCGCGNFTIPLAAHFRKVLATEVSKTSIRAAQFACVKNSIENIHFARLSGNECIEALKGIRSFQRLKGVALDTYNFQSVLVDPPRAGIGETMCRFLQDFKQIIYISCNPHTLAKDLEFLKKTHRIKHFAFFDQFPHTLHIETCVVLSKCIAL